METENNQEVKPEAGRAKIPVQRLVMCDMACAPKDGSSIILVWETLAADIGLFQIRECYWEDFSYLDHDRREKLSPQWKYVDDNNFSMTVSDPIGWLPCPELGKYNRWKTAVTTCPV